MATTISEEVRAIFTGDTSDLKRKVDEGKAKLAELRKANDAGNAASSTKNTLLNPSSLVGQNIDKLVKSMKVSALVGGVAGAAFELVGSAISNITQEAREAKVQSDALNESLRRTSNANTFTSASEGLGSLAGRLTNLREQQIAAREEGNRLNPTDFRAQNALSTTYALNSRSFSDPFGKDALNLDRQTNASQQQRLAQQVNDISPKITESLSRQVDLTNARLASDQNSARALELEIERQQELNQLKAAGVGTEENQSLINQKYDQQISAAISLENAVNARHATELGILRLQTSSLSTQQQSVAAAQSRLAQMRQELSMRSSLSTEEARSLELQRVGDENIVRNAQRSIAMESPGARNRRFYAQQRREARNRRADARIDATDGLVSVQRDASGRITGGTDLVTGLRRAVSPGFMQNTGLQTGGLGPSFVLPSFGQNRFNGNSLPGLTSLKDTGHDTDVGHGRTLLAAQNKLVDAMDVNNAYTKQMQVDLSFIAANIEYKT